MNSYSAIAKYYEKFTQNDCDYDKWAEFIVARLVFGQSGADLACGTGKMTRRLNKLGFEVIGVDSSIEMLNAAKSAGGGLYVNQEMTEFLLHKKVDFITVVNDGVNYLSQQLVPKFLLHAAEALRGGGKLIFDVSTPYKLTEVLGGNVFYYDFNEATCLWTNKQKNGCVVLDITVFEKQGSLYKRFDEQHTQYIHQIDGMLQLLSASGFETEVTDNYTSKKLNTKSLRATFVATKRDK